MNTKGFVGPSIRRAISTPALHTRIFLILLPEFRRRLNRGRFQSRRAWRALPRTKESLGRGGRIAIGIVEHPGQHPEHPAFEVMRLKVMIWATLSAP